MASPKIGHFHKTSLKWLASFLFALLFVLCGIYLLGPAVRARHLLYQLSALHVDHSSREDAERLAKKLGAKQDDTCDRYYCFWSVTADNASLPRWWRGPAVTFVIAFEVNASIVTYKSAGYLIGTSTTAFAPAEVFAGEKDKWIYIRPHANQPVIVEPPTAAGWRVSYFEKNGSRTVATEKFEIRMTPRSPPGDWQKYTDFNLSCFWKFKGCKDARELLPIAGSTPLPHN